MDSSFYRHNQQLAYKIITAKPVIGNQSEWTSHFKNYKKKALLIRKHQQNQQYDPTQSLKEFSIKKKRRKSNAKK